MDGADMPLYEFQCWGCNEVTEALRKVGNFSPCRCRVCGGSTEHIISAPTMHTWNQDRQFPNIRKAGDGAKSFETKAEYEVYLKETDQAEVSTDAPKINKLGHKTIESYK